MISLTKWEKLKAWMEKLEIQEADIVEKFIIGRGKGGQKLQKTASTVYIKHRPSNIEVKCQDVRSREDNRYFARVRLCEKIDERTQGEQSQKQQAIEKQRRQKKRRSRRLQKKILADKSHRGNVKKLRQKPDLSD